MARFSEGDFFSSEDEEHHSEYEDEYDEEDGEDPDAFLSAIPVDLVNRWKQSEMGMEDKKLNCAVLRQAVDTCEKSFLWRFRSYRTKMQAINATYVAMLDLVKGEG